MKNYVVFDYQNWADLSADLTAELNELINNPVSAVHKKYGECKVSCFVVSINESNFNILADFSFADETKKLALNILLKNGLVQIDDYDSFELLNQFISSLTDLQVEVHNVQYDRTSAKHEADRQAKELAKQEAKRKATMEKTIHDFEVLARQDRTKCASGEFYYSLGWLAKHCGVITAKLPDYLGKSFESYFGSDVPKTLIDTSGKTSGGFAKQWSWEFVCSIKKAKDLDVPPIIRDTTSDITKGIHNTSFIWDLVANYGFQFGKTQDLEKIRESIPAHCIQYFEKGYAE
jgi:hypothetical protein